MDRINNSVNNTQITKEIIRGIIISILLMIVLSIITAMLIEKKTITEKNIKFTPLIILPVCSLIGINAIIQKIGNRKLLISGISIIIFSIVMIVSSFLITRSINVTILKTVFLIALGGILALLLGTSDRKKAKSTRRMHKNR